MQTGADCRQIQVQGLACGGANDDPNGIACLAPRWSPDGTKIIFVAVSPATGSNIYTVNADGSGLAQVTFDGGSDSPAGEPTRWAQAKRRTATPQREPAKGSLCLVPA
jgi:hypothetical protein